MPNKKVTISTIKENISGGKYMTEKKPHDYLWTEYDGDESYWEELENETEKKVKPINDENIKSIFEIEKERLMKKDK